MTMTESQINWTLGATATLIALLLGAYCGGEQLTLMVAVCSFAWAVVMFCNWIEAKEAKAIASKDLAKVRSEYSFLLERNQEYIVESQKLENEIEAFKKQIQDYQFEVNMLRGDLQPMQDVIDKKDAILQTQSDTINAVVAIVEEYRDYRPRRLPWKRVAEAVGISEEGK